MMYHTLNPILLTTLIGGLLYGATACGGASLKSDGDVDGETAGDITSDENVYEAVDTEDDPDLEESFPDVYPDTPPDGTDTFEEDSPPVCVYDDTVHHDSSCNVVRVDIARDLPGWTDRARYYIDVSCPGGDYDRSCLRLDGISVINMSEETVRTSEAGYMTADGVFIIETEATAGELLACNDQARIGVFEIEYHGESPVGTFSGTCSAGTGWGWPPKVTLACHTGLEASFVHVEPNVSPAMGFASVYIEGILGNHGTAALTDFSLGEPTWQNLDVASEFMILTGWSFADRTDPPWEERVEPGTWQPVQFVWQSWDTLPPESLCPPYDETDLDETPSHLAIPGAHSSGTFVIETHPFTCMIPPGG